MAGYTSRQATYTTGDTIEAAHSNDEFNTILAAFNASTGHTHDGTAGEGAFVPLIADADGNNKLASDTSNNRFGVFVEVTGSPVEQFRFQDGAIVPVITNDIDLGTSSLEFKDAYFDGTVTVDAIAFPTTTVTDILDEDTMSSDSDTALATQQSIKAYVDSQVTAQDLDFQADTGGALSIDLDSESLTLTGGTGIDTSGALNTVTFAIDNTVVATLTDSQTLTNKILTTPVISSISNTGTITLPTATTTLIGTDTSDTLTNKTIDASQLSGTVANARLDAELQALAGLTSAADKGIQFTGSGAAATYDLTAAGKALLDDADAAAQRSTLGLGTASTLAVGVSNTNVAQFGSGIADNDFLKINSTTVEGRSAAEVLSDIGGQASLTFGISNTNAVKIDSASVADDEYARFTANGLESRSNSEVLSDIGATSATDAANEATALAIALG